MRLKCQRESLASFHREAGALMQKHHAEVDEWADIPLEIDLDRFEAMDAAGKLRIYTARLDRGPADLLPLIGYAIFFVGTHMHRNSHLEALCYAVYIEKDQRKGSTGIELIRYADKQLKGEAVQAIYHPVKGGHPNLGVVLASQEYVPIEIVWGKRFDA